MFDWIEVEWNSNETKMEDSEKKEEGKIITLKNLYGRRFAPLLKKFHSEVKIQISKMMKDM